MAIGLKKLLAGSGYEYLTRQVAVGDVTGKGHSTLADYYTAKGEAPGRWWGAGLAGMHLVEGQEVTAEQMKRLFGAGLDPVTGAKLGRAYPVFADHPTAFETELDRRTRTWQQQHDGLPVPKAVRQRLRTHLAIEWHTRDHGRPPAGRRELHSYIAKATSHQRVAVAGFDLTFSPPKSVSALWALAGPDLAAALRAAHTAAVEDALIQLQTRVAATRSGHEGARHVEVRGISAALFDHRDSRAGDPDLHTHAAISAKVQTLTGDWRALDAKPLYAAKVYLSEVYTTSLTARLRDLGLAMTPVGREGKRPVYEIAGLEPGLLARWSTRRARIQARTADLVTTFEHDHERPPTKAERLDLAQQATLDTRPAKHAPRSEAEQRTTWKAEAVQLLGPAGLDRMLHDVAAQPRVVVPVVDEAWVAQAAQRAINTVEAERSSWTPWNVRAEALRQVRAAAVPLDQITRVAETITTRALDTASLPIRTTRAQPVEPAPLLGPEGASVYAQTSATRYTSRRILYAERRLVDTAGRLGGRVADHNSVTLALLQAMANREPLNPEQQSLVRDMATSGRRLQLGIAPAGTGKTTAMRALATAWTSSGGTVVGLAPSATAAEQLRSQLGDGAVADNLAKLVWAIAHHEPLAAAVGPDTLVIIDEAGMADTLTLDHLVSWCLDQGASLRLIGDDQQLGAIGAGGVLRDIATQHGAVRLDHVVRFTNPAEAEASLALRAGDAGALGFYLDHHRVHVVDPDTATSRVLTAWQTDIAAGLDALMLAPTREQVAGLNAAARAARLDGHRPCPHVDLSDHNQASTGDTVITRRNNRDLASSDTAWVRNGDRWRVTAVHRDGSIDVQHLRNHNQLTLPADYVAEFVELGYATTIHAAQGVTADTCHGLLTGEESRQQAYTMLTRGRHANHAWLQVENTDTHVAPVDPGLWQPATGVQLLETVIARDEAPASATTLLRQADEPALLLGPAVTCYVDAITYAAEHHLPAQVKGSIDAAGAKHGLDRADAWPTLRSHLMLVAANGHDPLEVVNQAVALGALDQARDRAAVIDYRLDVTQANNRTRGPLPWLPGIPVQLLDDPTWKAYLSGRYQLTRQLADETRHRASADTPRWAQDLYGLDPALVADIQQWRAAHQTPDTDLRPTGAPQFSGAEHDAQRRLDRALETSQAGIREWLPKITAAAPACAGDPSLPAFAAHLANLARHRPELEQQLADAAGLGPLPVEHAADALRYRITDLIHQGDEMARREAASIMRAHQPHRQPPPPTHGPRHGHDRGISI
jgi:conjugative relaxase-like TrwC/TraI family protein